MKKILALIAVILSVTFAQAQTPTANGNPGTMTNPNALALDTASQAAAEGPKVTVKSYQSTVALEIVLTKISGTIAGTVKWQGSLDGTNWFTLQTDTLTDASANWGYTEAPKKWLHYKALITQTGTSSLSYKGIVYTTSTTK